MTATPRYPLRDWINSIVPDVFDTMLDLTATPLKRKPVRHVGQRISGAIGIAGETITGVVYLHLTHDFATQITASMLGCFEGTAPTDAEINDVVAEFCNMICGRFKSSLCNYATPCAMSTPSIIRGSAFAIESSPKAWAEVFAFECLEQALSVEVHLEQQTYENT